MNRSPVDVQPTRPRTREYAWAFVVVALAVLWWLQ